MEIHALAAHTLVKKLQAGELSSAEIVDALLARADAVDPIINAFVLRRRQVREEAAACDAARARGEALGPLHGLPISIKDNIDVARTDSTLGLRNRVGKPATTDAVMVRSLRDAGAIVLGKTNVPQLLLAQETENAVFGVTRNPWSLAHVPGGSSGGEAAAVASGMSPLGIGTDIGGSIRIPAHFCGVYGFKPTLDRWSNRGSQTGIPGQELVRAQLGALARSARDLSLLWRAVDPRRQALLDGYVPPLAAPDPDEVDIAGLRIGMLTGDPFLQPAHSLERAVAEASEVLAAAGAEVVEYTPISTEEIIYLWLGAISADGARTMDRALAGEEVCAQLKPSRQLLGLPRLARLALAKVLAARGEWRVAKLLEVLGEKRVDAYWAATAKRTTLRRRELDGWRDAGIDALLCPPHVVAAIPHRASSDFALSLGAQFRWTLLNFPAGVAPVTLVRPDDVGLYPTASDRVERKLDALDRQSVGLPVGVQVVARPHEEHVLLAVMRVLEDGLGARQGFPHTPVSLP